MLLVALVLVPLAMFARNYDVSLEDVSPEVAFQTIKKATGYEFVYNKGVLNGLEKKKVTGNFNDMSLEQILNRVVMLQLGLDFEIVDKTIVISKSAGTKYFKSAISGQVIDENGEPLAGATVSVPGTPSVVATDIDGQFSMLVEGKVPRLEVSYVGMKTVSMKIDPSKKFFVIEMKFDPTLMNEVVITGYQNLKRENATGAYQTVTSADIDRSFTGSVTDRLEGKVPGLVTYNNGDGQKMTIRGLGSFQAETQPLIVVDGLPIQGGIETVNPYDIQNITVLKDAAAASIYGARAANGVVVITTKRATSDKVTIDFNADITVTEKNNYDNYGWASAAEIIELEKYNFEYMKNRADQGGINSLKNDYTARRSQMPSAIRALMANYMGDLSDSELESTLARYASNDYRKEWRDKFQRTGVQQLYNLAMRVQGRSLNSSIVLNYMHNNPESVTDRNSAITFKYRGDLKVAPWLNLVFGANVISERSKSYWKDFGQGGINEYSPIRSLYNADGSLADMTEGVYDALPSMQVTEYGLKSMYYNPLSEIKTNPISDRRTNIRTYLQANFNILPGWSANGMFQYEDIYYKKNTYREADSYAMRSLYNFYTGNETKLVGSGEYDWDTWEEIMVPGSVLTHYIPEGGIMQQLTSEGAYWTFRAQTQYNRRIFEKHNIDAVAGFEYRDMRDKGSSTLYYGYDDQTQQNKNSYMNFGQLNDIQGNASVLGEDYAMYGAPTGSNYFYTNDILHRFYSLYFNANYVYDSRYSLSASWRLDKTDLFGADPKFRGRPLWSVGVSWNAHNESFMRDLTWIDALKPRLSYGLTGNIDSSVSSYLTASFMSNDINGNNAAILNNPPNDQLRWEKTQTWNAGIDFSFLGYRISGSFDYYHKRGSDLLCETDVDPTNGISYTTINNGICVNRGVELQLNGQILRPATRKHLGINAYLNLAFNKNKIVYVNREPASGSDALYRGRLHQGYPISGLFSFDYAGIEVIDGMQYMKWRDHNGEIHNTSLDDNSFTVEDIVYSGSLDPKVVGSFTPELTWNGFSLSSMFTFYGGHVMRVNTDVMTGYGSERGYGIHPYYEGYPSSYLEYWRTGDDTRYLANGYPSKFIAGYAQYNAQYANTNVVHADYLKVRNIVFGYTLPQNLTRRAGINEARLRVQMTNVATWVRNSQGKDPEAVNAFDGSNRDKAPRQYTFSLYLNF